MMFQGVPLTFTIERHNPEARVEAPRQLRLDQPTQIAGYRFKRLSLRGTIDLPSAEHVVAFNKWLALAKGGVLMGGEPQASPKGTITVQRIGPARLQIEADLMCNNDFGDLAMTVNNVLAEAGTVPGYGH